MTADKSASPREEWRRYMTDFNEGLGLVYERLVLNDFLEGLMERYHPGEILEAPVYGMAGVTGINSVRFAQSGAHVTLVDSNSERIEGIRQIWAELGLSAAFVHVGDFATLPFKNKTFDLAWNWAALWHLPKPERLIEELARISRNLIFVAMPNRAQFGYILRKYLLERDFGDYVDEGWADTHRIKKALASANVTIVDEGVIDVPPWPDTVMPAGQVLQKLGVRSTRLSGAQWNWSTMDYYLGRRPDLKAKMERYAFLERAPLPWRLKTIWAHHRYLVGSVSA